MTTTAFRTIYDVDDYQDVEIPALGNLSPEAVTLRHGHDIFEDFELGTTNVILHAMNRKSNFRHGFSRQLANRFPQASAADMEAAERGGVQKGDISVSVEVDYDGTERMIINLYCMRNKAKDGTLISYRQLRSALTMANHVLQDYCEDHGQKPVVGFVKFGTGIAGGDWDKITTIIRDSLNSDNYEGVLYA